MSGQVAAEMPGQASEGMAILDFGRLARAEVRTDPYPYLVAREVVRPEAIPALRRDFPMIRQTGFHPTDAFEATGSFAALLREMEGEEIARVVGDKLGVNLVGLPRLITVRRLSAKHEGRIHTDSESKVVTLLIYLNSTWDSPEGRFRVLRRGDSFEDYAEEVGPEEGNALAFVRSTHSWHGHTPFVGERRVVQMAWLRDASELERKRKRHGLSHTLRKLFGMEQRG